MADDYTGKGNPYIVMAHIVLAYTVMAYIVMASIVVASTVMASTVVASIVMADKYTGKGNPTDKCGSHASGYTEYKVASDSVGPRVFKLPHTDFTRVKAEIYHGGSSTVSWNVYQSGYDRKGSHNYIGHN